MPKIIYAQTLHDTNSLIHEQLQGLRLLEIVLNPHRSRPRFRHSTWKTVFFYTRTFTHMGLKVSAACSYNPHIEIARKLVTLWLNLQKYVTVILSNSLDKCSSIPCLNCRWKRFMSDSARCNLRHLARIRQNLQTIRSSWACAVLVQSTGRDVISPSSQQNTRFFTHFLRTGFKMRRISFIIIHSYVCMHACRKKI